MYLCMYVCMHRCMYVGMYVCMYVGMHVCIYAGMDIKIYVYRCIWYVHVYMQACICLGRTKGRGGKDTRM